MLIQQDSAAFASAKHILPLVSITGQPAWSRGGFKGVKGQQCDFPAEPLKEPAGSTRAEEHVTSFQEPFEFPATIKVNG